MRLERQRLKFDKQVMLLGIVFHIFGADNKNNYYMIPLISELKI